MHLYHIVLGQEHFIYIINTVKYNIYLKNDKSLDTLLILKKIITFFYRFLIII